VTILFRSAGSLISIALLAIVHVAAAQPTDKPRVLGILSLSAEPTLRDEVFERRLRELGWIEGQNARFEYRRAANKIERLPALAEELVRLNVHVIVAQSTPAVKAAKDATRTIPIVSISADPVANGFVASLARPGGNITGVSMMMPELAGKGLELLREVAPKLSRVAYLAHGDDPSHRLFLKETGDAGRRLGVRVQPVIIRGPQEFDAAFAAMKRERAGALIVQPLFVNTMGLGPQLAELSAKNGLAAISSADVFADVGGLMVHAPDPLATYQRVATFVDQVLRGANPAELPIEQPQKFSLTINLKTAKRLGLRVPQSLLLRADKVIE
jgi:putative ABC transport system substrate-binding protein